MAHPDRVRRQYLPCEAGAVAHRFADFVNGQILSHGMREGVVYERRCVWCRRLWTDWNVIEGDHHDVEAHLGAVEP